MQQKVTEDKSTKKIKWNLKKHWINVQEGIISGKEEQIEQIQSK